MANWSRLSEHLATVEGETTFTWDQLADLVGGLPPSAAKHRAWWGGDRPHVRVWRDAGFRVAAIEMGRQVTFGRTAPGQGASVGPSPTTARQPRSRQPVEVTASLSADIVLVTCVKTKLPVPAAAKDLYTSSLFVKERTYAEQVGAPWFILSAEHGLVAPEEWLAPYERYLPDTSASYRDAWGAWVAARLDLLAGPLRGQNIEIHASSAYVDAVRSHLEALGAVVSDPLHGLTHGRRLAWYDQSRAGTQDPVDPAHDEPATDEPATDLAATVERLLDPEASLSPAEFLASRDPALDRPGLYSWWVDDDGAADLSAGLGLQVTAGLIYAGLAGATRWPSGRRSGNTLWGRISTMHLAGNHEFSTFRRTLASALPTLRVPDGSVDETALTEWMHSHLRLIATPYDDADTLGQLEGAVLDQLDPPLNLQGRPTTPLRLRLKELRRALTESGR